MPGALFHWLPDDSIVQAPVVQKMDNAILSINLFSVDKAIGFLNTYPLDSDLSGEWRYPSFEQPRPDKLYPVESAIGFPNTYPVDTDLSDG